MAKSSCTMRLPPGPRNATDRLPTKISKILSSYSILLVDTLNHVQYQIISVNIVNTSRIWNKKEQHATPMRFFSAPSQAMNGEEKDWSTQVDTGRSRPQPARVQEHHRRQSSVPNLRQSLSCQLLALQWAPAPAWFLNRHPIIIDRKIPKE